MWKPIAFVLAVAGCGGQATGGADGMFSDGNAARDLAGLDLIGRDLAANDASVGDLAAKDAAVDDLSMARDSAGPPGPDMAQPVCPCYAGGCANGCWYCGTALQTYASMHGCVVPNLTGHTGDLFSCVAPDKTSPGNWTLGTTCPNGCSLNPSGPDFCTSSATHKLWIAYDGSNAGCAGGMTNMWNCIFGHSNFDQLEAAWPNGRALGLGAVQTIGSHCDVHHDYCCASVADDSATLNCIENQTKWPVATGDVILYFPTSASAGTNVYCANTHVCRTYGGGCSDGRNHWGIPVQSNGATATVSAAFSFSGTSCNCQQAFSSHEVYEASAEAQSADCCNGQFNCAPNPAPYGWYPWTCCNASFTVQTLSPFGHEFDGTCDRLSCM
jgi:hypothetical protein